MEMSMQQASTQNAHDGTSCAEEDEKLYDDDNEDIDGEVWRDGKGEVLICMYIYIYIYIYMYICIYMCV
jgi:hypothetical protein